MNKKQKRERKIQNELTYNRLQKLPEMRRK